MAKSKRGNKPKAAEPAVLPFTPENFNSVLVRYEEAAKPAATPAPDDALEWTRLVWQGMLVDAQMLQPGHTLTRQRVRMMLEAAEKAKEGKV